jgi:hypothetical protein
MARIEHLFEPLAMRLLWQPSDESGASRTRRTVGEITRDLSGLVEFRYLRNDPEFLIAEREGFKGYPAFNLKTASSREGVLDALLLRLPPRQREDFNAFLAQHSLPIPFTYSDFALLAFTGARLPSDGFSLVPVFPEALETADYITEIAGVRHVYQGDSRSIVAGIRVHFVQEPENEYDADAVAVFTEERKLGYVNRGLRRTFNHWIEKRELAGEVCRIGGASDRPVVHVRVSVRPRSP